MYLCGFVSLYLCNFVSLYVRMFVARANKVEGTLNWCLGTNEIVELFKHGVAEGRTRALWDRLLDSSQFFRLLLRLQVFGNILNIFMIQTLCTVRQLFKGSYFSVDAISRHFWPNSAIANGTNARIYELLRLALRFTSPKVISSSPQNFLMSRIDFTVLL